MESLFNKQYGLAKALYNSFSKDFMLSKVDPSIDYDPYHKTNDGLKSQPHKYTLQGIYLRIVDRLADTLLIEESRTPNNILRTMSFGEFQKKYFEEKVDASFIRISKLFQNLLHTENLCFGESLTQAGIYRAITTTYKDKNLDQFWRVRLQKILYTTCKSIEDDASTINKITTSNVTVQ